MYHIWESKPLGIDIYSEKVMLQKLQDIHQSPLPTEGGVCEVESFTYSSAQFYLKGNSEWTFLTHYLS